MEDKCLLEVMKVPIAAKWPHLLANLFYLYYVNRFVDGDVEDMLADGHGLHR